MSLRIPSLLCGTARSLQALALSLALAGCGAEEFATDGGHGAPCDVAADCDDSVFCNGEEVCAAGQCEAGSAPCAAASCDEVAASCSTGCLTDADGDGVRSIECGGNDCDDGDPERFPGGVEVCDLAGLDEDCDPATFGFRDADSDTHADAACCNGAGTEDEHCGDDCDDARASANLAAADVCNGLDDDCDEDTDEDLFETTYYVDGDGDGVGRTPIEACGLLPGLSATGGDCDDTTSAKSPTNVETCDSNDNDCDGMTDEVLGAACTTGTGSCEVSGNRDCSGACIVACAASGDGVCNAGVLMCTGGDFTCVQRFPPSPEICDGGDNNCDGVTDEGC